MTTRRTVTLDVSFEADCASTIRVGQADVTLLRRQGDTFGFDLEAPWTGRVTGTIGRSGITLEVRASGTIGGETCDTGPLTLALDRRLR